MYTTKKKDGWVRYQNGRKFEIYYKEHLYNTEQYVNAKKFIEKYMDSTPGLNFTKIIQLNNEKQLANFYKTWSSLTCLPIELENQNISPCKQHVFDEFQRILDKCSYNTDKFANPIILTAHGTEQLYGMEIALSGISSIGTANGQYGNGLYSSTDPIFCYPYFRNARQPAVLISWLLPGEVNYISSKKDDSYLNKTKFGCNFVCVKRNGQISSDYTQNKHNEIIISHEDQYLPLFLIEISKDNFESLEQKWNRVISDPKFSQEQVEHRTDVDLEFEQ